MLNNLIKKSLCVLSLVLVFGINTVSANSNNSLNLSSLTLNVQGLMPEFNKEKTNYAIFVGTNVNNIEVEAIPEDKNSNVSITGNENLKIGDNKIQITVTSKENKTKNYNILVTKTDSKQKSDSYLANLILENIELQPAFEPQILDYNAGNIPSDLDKILLFAAPEEENATVEVIGNENLKIGENTITIKVTSEDKFTIKEYNIKVNKLKNKTVEQVNNENIEKIKTQDFLSSKMGWFGVNQAIAIIIVLVIIILILSIVLFKKNRRK